MARPNVVKLIGVDSKNGEIIAVYISHELSGYKGKFVPERPSGELIDKHLIMEELQRATANATSTEIARGLLEAQRIVTNMKGD